MKLNCWPGCMAVIVNSVAGNGGEIVECLEFLGETRWLSKRGEIYKAAAWRIDKKLIGWRGDADDTIEDQVLRPITPPAGTITESEVTALYTPTEIKRAKESVE